MKIIMPLIRLSANLQGASFRITLILNGNLIMVFLYPGAIHIHSIHSDGTGTIEEIAHAAKKAGLSWIIITDHNNMDGEEGIYDGVYVIVGEEITPETENHYIALDIETPISSDLHVKEYIQEVKNQGGFGFIVHPDGEDCRKNNFMCLPWRDWKIKDFGGLEIWNYMSNWVDCYDNRNIFKILYAFLFRNNILSGPTRKTLNWWDDLNNEKLQIIPAIGGVDTHAFRIKIGFVTIKIFPYKTIFGTVTNFIHIDNPLPKDYKTCREVILDAIKTGKNLIMNRNWRCSWWSCKKPVFYIQNNDKKIYSGGSIEFDTESEMVVELPLKANIRVIHNGKIILQKAEKNLKVKNLDKGKYRIEVYYRNRPWIFSNPILVK